MKDTMEGENQMLAASRISVSDLSESIAAGLQRALEVRRKEELRDYIIRYGGRVIFEVEMIPAHLQGAINEVRNIER